MRLFLAALLALVCFVAPSPSYADRPIPDAPGCTGPNISKDVAGATVVMVAMMGAVLDSHKLTDTLLSRVETVDVVNFATTLKELANYAENDTNCDVPVFTKAEAKSFDTVFGTMTVLLVRNKLVAELQRIAPKEVIIMARDGVSLVRVYAGLKPLPPIPHTKDDKKGDAKPDLSDTL